MAAIKEGLQRLGHEVVEHNDNADMAVICSTLWLGRMMQNKNIFTKYRTSNRNVLIYDSGAIERGVTWRLGLNAVNAEGYFGPTGNNKERRKLLGLKVIPWQKRAGHLLICTQHSRSFHWRNMPTLPLWCSKIVDLAKKAGWQKIIIRPHPRSSFPHSAIKAKGTKIEVAKKLGDDHFDFDRALQGAAAVVNFSSNPGLIAAMRGIPIFVGPRSLAYGVSCGSLDDMVLRDYPDQHAWLNDFAYTEWKEEEFKTGKPMERLLNTYSG